MQELPFVGREHELAQLHSFLGRALAGEGQVCFITGQAGTGKSALVRHFVEQAVGQHPGLIAALGQCNAQTGLADPYLPFREALSLLTGDADAKPVQGATNAENASRVRTAFVRSVQVLVEVAPDLVGLFVPGGKLLGELGKAVATKVGWMDDLEALIERKGRIGGDGSAGVEQIHIFEQYTLFLQKLAAEHPLILVLDDLHWADAASISLLFYLGRRVGKHRILLVGTYRPDDVALGRGDERHPLEPLVNEFKRYLGSIAIDLDRATVEEGRGFVDALMDKKLYQVSDGFREALFRQTGGHALFTVEILQSLKESGGLRQDAHGRWVEGPDLDWTQLPAKIEGVIEERIMRLNAGLRHTLTVASVEGEQFTAEVVARVCGDEARDIVRFLSDDLARTHQLVQAAGLRRLKDRRLSLYRFTHNLFQKYLYASLTEAERVYLHEDIGRALEHFYAGQSEEIAVQLAHHFEQAGLAPKAVQYLLQAGNSARRVSAHQEAYVHLKKALELLEMLPAGSLERVAYELGCQVALGTTLIALRGYGSEEVREAFSRARECCREMGDPPQVIPVLFGLCLYYIVNGQVKRSHEEAAEILQLAENAGDRIYIMAIRMLLGVASFYSGQFSAARDYLAQALALYQPARDGILGYQQGQDPAVTSLSFLSWVLWALGYPQQALEKRDESVSLGQEVGHPYSHALAVALASSLEQYRRDWRACQTRAEEGMRLAKQGHFALWEALAMQTLGLSLSKQGQTRAGLAVYQHAMDAWRRTGSRVGFTAVLTYLAEVYLDAGHFRQAHQALDEAFVLADETGQGWWLAEQYRVRGEILLAQNGDAAGAADCIRQGLEIARQQGAKMLELRAALSLARLPQSRAAEQRAREELAQIYGWFTEGQDAPDLIDARALLEAKQPARDRPPS